MKTFIALFFTYYPLFRALVVLGKAAIQATSKDSHGGRRIVAEERQKLNTAFWIAYDAKLRKDP